MGYGIWDMGYAWIFLAVQLYTHNPYRITHIGQNCRLACTPTRTLRVGAGS